MKTFTTTIEKTNTAGEFQASPEWEEVDAIDFKSTAAEFGELSEAPEVAARCHNLPAGAEVYAIHSEEGSSFFALFEA